jgi:hypothetical protein
MAKDSGELAEKSGIPLTSGWLIMLAVAVAAASVFLIFSVGAAMF